MKILSVIIVLLFNLGVFASDIGLAFCMCVYYMRMQSHWMYIILYNCVFRKFTHVLLIWLRLIR